MIVVVGLPLGLPAHEQRRTERGATAQRFHYRPIDRSNDTQRSSAAGPSAACPIGNRSKAHRKLCSEPHEYRPCAGARRRPCIVRLSRHASHSAYNRHAPYGAPRSRWMNSEFTHIIIHYVCDVRPSHKLLLHLRRKPVLSIDRCFGRRGEVFPRRIS